MKKRTKPMTYSLVALLLALALSACSGGGSGVSGGGETSGAPTSHSGSEEGGANSAGKPAGNTGSTGNTGKRTIVFQTFWPDARFAEAKQKYEALHPEIEIKLQYTNTTDSTFEAELEKFITTTNTAMLSGKGPDIMEMDQLPLEQYVKNGLLVDMETLIERDSTFKRDDYFTNVLDNSKIGGGLYGMPMSFFLMGFAGDTEAINKAGIQVDDSTWTWDDFAAMGEKLVKGGTYKNVIMSMPESMLSMMVMDDYETYVDVKNRKANFESEAFINRMKQVKAMAESGVIGDQRPYFYHSQINSPGDYFTTLNEFLAKDMTLYAKPHSKETGAGGYFRSYRTIGLNAASTVKQEAWDFIKFMMSDEITASPLTAGFPINKKAYAKSLEELKKEGSVKGHPDGPLQGASVKVDEAMLDRLTGYVNGAIHPVNYQSDKLSELIVEESTAFFKGQKTAEAVAKLIQNKATTILNE